MKIVVDIFYFLAFVFFVFLVYFGCRQDIRNMSPLQEIKKNKKKMEDEPTKVETFVADYVKEDIPSYSDVREP